MKKVALLFCMAVMLLCAGRWTIEFSNSDNWLDLVKSAILVAFYGFGFLGFLTWWRES